MEMTIEARDRGFFHAFTTPAFTAATTAMAVSALHRRTWIWRVARIVMYKFPFIERTGPCIGVVLVTPGTEITQGIRRGRNRGIQISSIDATADQHDVGGAVWFMTIQAGQDKIAVGGGCGEVWFLKINKC